MRLQAQLVIARQSKPPAKPVVLIGFTNDIRLPMTRQPKKYIICIREDVFPILLFYLQIPVCQEEQTYSFCKPLHPAGQRD